MTKLKTLIALLLFLPIVPVMAQSGTDTGGTVVEGPPAGSGTSTPFTGGTLSSPLYLFEDPAQPSEAVTLHYFNQILSPIQSELPLPTNSIPYQGTSGTAPISATAANIDSLFTSTTYASGLYNPVQTTFNEGTAGTAIVGTKPATDAPNASWVIWPSMASGWVFNTSGGAKGTAASQGMLLNTAQTNGTITFSGVTNTATQLLVFRYTDASNWLALYLLGSGGVKLEEAVAGTVTIVGSNVSIANGTTGSVVITVNGTSVSVVPFGGTAINYTIPGGHTDANGTNVGLFTGSAGTFVVGGITFQATGLAPSTVACSGYLNADGTCSTSGANAFVVNDNNGHHAALPEMGTATTTLPGQAPVTTIAWQDDFRAGLYDIRDPRWGPQDTPAHQAVAIQAMSTQMACDMKAGVVSQAVALIPQGDYAVDQLQMAPGSSWIARTPVAAGGAHFYTIYNNHMAAYAHDAMTMTCNGVSQTLNKTNAFVSHISFTGCAQGGCTNAPGDTANYQFGGPGNVGFEMGSTGGVIEHSSSGAFGGYGIRVDGQDTKAFHLTTQTGLQWYYYGNYKGVTETAASPEQSATTTGTTGSVALSWTAVPSAAGYVIYKGTTAGGENSWFSTTSPSFTDTCAAGTTGQTALVTNVVTNSLATPGAITATPSATGGTCAAGTYYYKITAYGNDGWHAQAEISGTDSMADWVESYGPFDAPTVYTYHHLADISAGGGYSHYDHLWPQLGLVGLVQAGAQGIGDVYENLRVDFARLEGVFLTAANVSINNAIIDGSCTAPNAVTINTGQVRASFAGTCVQLYSSTGGLNKISNVKFLDNNGFGTTQKTADMLLESTDAVNVTGSYQYIPAEGLKAGKYTLPQNVNWVSVTGPTPSVIANNAFSPADSAPITYTGFLNVQVGQDFYIYGGNANVTIADNSYIKTCTGANINLGSVAGVVLHFRYTGAGSAGLFGLPVAVAQVCSNQPAQPTIASSETVTFSATPTFSTATRASVITLTANITSFTMAAGADGQEKTLTFCQNATGGFTVTAPSNVSGLVPIGAAANLCTGEHFTYSTAKTLWINDATGTGSGSASLPTATGAGQALVSAGAGTTYNPTTLATVATSGAYNDLTGKPSIVSGSETVTFSATPTFVITTRASIITLTGNIASFTLPAGADGQEKTLIFCQDATGSRTVAPPANVHGFMSVGTTASKCSAQEYSYSVGQSAWLASSVGVINE